MPSRPPISIATLFIGPARPLARPGHPPVASGIAKEAVTGPVWLGTGGLAGDEQGDLVYHGGPEKAVHHYAAEHYAWWRARFAGTPVALAPGAFGDNVSTLGMTERDVCIGDIYRAGSALLQVSQGRQPCWRLNRRLGRDDAAETMQAAGVTGWYYRVLEPGTIARGDGIALRERPCPGWTMERLVRALFPPDPAAPGLRDEWRQAAALAPLSSNWQAAFARRVDTGRIEDWSRRLREP